VVSSKVQRPYFEAWLKRTRRHLAPSGRLSEAALILSREEGGSESTWRQQLRALLEGDELPSIDLLTRIDSLLSPAKTSARTAELQTALL
jgi:hypothetical protein